jgi:hypothetical protein
MGLLNVIRVVLRLLLSNRSSLIAENLALRQQLAIFSRSARRARLRQRDRIFWVWISRLWRGWRSAIVVVQPDTVVRWHGRGFRLYWRWKSRRRPRVELLRSPRSAACITATPGLPEISPSQPGQLRFAEHVCPARPRTLAQPGISLEPRPIIRPSARFGVQRSSRDHGKERGWNIREGQV